MKGFNQCRKGHFYKESLSNCPYCPTDMATDIETSQYTAKTEVLRTEVSDKTGNRQYYFRYTKDTGFSEWRFK